MKKPSEEEIIEKAKRKNLQLKIITISSIILVVILINGYFEYQRNSRIEKAKKTYAEYERGVFEDPRDGEKYNWIKIGNQVWMLENLRYKTPNGSWAYHNNPRYVSFHGYLYNRENAVNVAPPPGWHVPSKREWQILMRNLGSENERDFLNQFGGAFNPRNNTFSGSDAYGYWWTKEIYGHISRGIRVEYVELGRNIKKDFKYQVGYARDYGFSVRCVRDY